MIEKRFLVNKKFYGTVFLFGLMLNVLSSCASPIVFSSLIGDNISDLKGQYKLEQVNNNKSNETYDLEYIKIDFLNYSNLEDIDDSEFEEGNVYISNSKTVAKINFPNSKLSYMEPVIGMLPLRSDGNINYYQSYDLNIEKFNINIEFFDIYFFYLYDNPNELYYINIEIDETSFIFFKEV